MAYGDRCLIGKLARDCDEKKKILEFNDDGKLVGFKMYCRAKDFKEANQNG